jgi:hypothetical protein
LLAYLDASPGHAGNFPGYSDTETNHEYPSALRRRLARPLGAISEGIVPKKSIQVVRFHVWQDLTTAFNGDAPLHATVTVEMPDAQYLNLNGPGGHIQIDGQNGETLVEAKLQVNQAHYGLGLSQPGTRQVQFAMSPVPMYSRLDQLEAVRGSARLRIGERTVTVTLPETKIIFTR